MRHGSLALSSYYADLLREASGQNNSLFVQIKNIFPHGSQFVGSISAAHSCPIYVPPRKETAGRVSGKPCL